MKIQYHIMAACIVFSTLACTGSTTTGIEDTTLNTMPEDTAMAPMMMNDTINIMPGDTSQKLP